MIRLLQWLRAFRVWASVQPLCPTQEPNWTEEDGKAFESFLAGSTGRKMVLLFRYREQSVNVACVSRPTDCTYNAGYACGFRAALAMVHTLSASVPPHPDDHDRSPDGAEDLAEKYAP